MYLFIPAIWMAAGFSLFAGVHFIITGAWRRREPGFLAFGLLCLLVATYLVLTAALYEAQSITAAGQIARSKIAIMCLAFPVSVWFLAEFTNLRNPKVWLFASCLLFGDLFILNLLSPNSLLYSQISRTAPMILPWGESLEEFSAQPTALAYIYYGASYLIFLWAMWRCWIMWRSGQKNKAWPITIYLFIQTIATLHDQIVVLMRIRGLPFSDFSFAMMILIMSFALRREMQDRQIALDKNLNALQAETEMRQRGEDRLHHMAYYDYLTDLPNRRLLNKIVHGALQLHRRSGYYGAIVFLDLDHFKTINDSLGHQIGDELLKLIATRLRNALPESRCVSRLGGDEFAVVLGNLEKDQELARTKAIQAARALATSLSHPFQIGHHELIVGASTGVTVFPDSNADESNIIRQADMALYSAKAAGRNTSAMFASQMQADATRRLAIEKGLRIALERRELKLYYQPQTDMEGQIIGAEALLRWFHPEIGFIEPSHFVPIAEETGLIHAIGEYVLRAVCAQIRTWDKERLPIPERISLNVSPWQLATRGFAAKVKSAIQSTGIEAKRLTLEITENALLQDLEEVILTIQELNALGVHFSIDDFGTGYSALSSLKKLPLHELKIDRLFVSEMSLDRKDSFIETIMAMAQHGGLSVIAEGVENDAQRMALAKLGCRGIQGYFISPPLSVREFERWLLQVRPLLPLPTTAKGKPLLFRINNP